MDNERLKSAFNYSANHYPQSGVRIENKLSKKIIEALVEENKKIERERERERVKALREENKKREIEISKRIKALKKDNVSNIKVVKKTIKNKITNTDLKESIINLIKENSFTAVSIIFRNITCSRSRIVNILQILLIEGKITKLDKFKFILKVEPEIKPKPVFNKKEALETIKDNEIKITAEQSKLSFEEYLQQKQEAQENKIKELNKKIFNGQQTTRDY